MKKIICLAAGLLALNLTPVFGQQPPGFPPPVQPPPHDVFQQRLREIINKATPPANQRAGLTKFNLDFPGGTPGELVKAIEKATGKPLNVIIPDDDADFQLPALTLNDITFPQLSDTLKTGSLEHHYVGSPFGYETGYWFLTTDNQPTDNSVWFFHVEKKPEQRPALKFCRFYSLAPFLDRGFTVDDITTAIQTGWKMSGTTPPPELDYHKETKLLIAYGEPSQLDVIQNVLNSLPSSNVTSTEIDRMKFQIDQLKKQVDELKKKTSGLVPVAAPAEKSGK